MKNYRLAIFASGGGTNAQEIINYFKDHTSIEVSLILSNNPNAYVLARALENNIPSKLFDRATYRDKKQILEWLHEYKITHIVLAGFLWLVPQYLLKAFPHRIINIHPALLPKHGGKGMYGMRVHESVKSSGDMVTGITIHMVDENYDEGRVLFQAQCDVTENDTAESIADKVHALEHQHYPKVIEELIINNY